MGTTSSVKKEVLADRLKRIRSSDLRGSYEMCVVEQNFSAEPARTEKHILSCFGMGCEGVGVVVEGQVATNIQRSGETQRNRRGGEEESIYETGISCTFWVMVSTSFLEASSKFSVSSGTSSSSSVTAALASFFS